MSFLKPVTVLAATCLSMAAAQTTATAQEFDCRRVELIVPYEAGGGTDLYARFLAPLLSKHLPNSPAVIVSNIEGAGAIAGSNQFQERAGADGCTLIAVAASVTSNFVFGDERVRYKADEWVPIISSPAGTVVYGSSSLGVDNLEDLSMLRDSELVMGANNPSGGDMRVILSLELLGLSVKPIYGINRGDARPGFERGEFNLNFDSSQAYPTQVIPLVEAGSAVPFFSFGVIDASGQIVRDPIVPDLPTLGEVYQTNFGKAPEGPLYEAWLAVFNLNVMASKALALPKETPPEIAEVYHSAMDNIIAELQLPENKAAADEIVGPYPQATREQAATILRGALKFSPETSAFLDAWIANQTAQ